MLLDLLNTSELLMAIVTPIEHIPASPSACRYTALLARRIPRLIRRRKLSYKSQKPRSNFWLVHVGTRRIRQSDPAHSGISSKKGSRDMSCEVSLLSVNDKCWCLHFVERGY